MTLSFVIRDGLESDIPACLMLDHTYDTDYVWQMRIQQEPRSHQIAFNTERLPRAMEVTYPADARRLQLSTAPEHCFLVAANREQTEVLGYLSMRSEPIYRIGYIHDLIVSRAYRHNRIGTRLLNVARGWAREHDLTQIIIELQTKNYPGINFCERAGLAFCGFNDHYFPTGDIAVYFTEILR